MADIVWTKEQYDKRDQVMRDSTIPLMGTHTPDGGYVGYVGSREMCADLEAANLYKMREVQNKIAKDILEDIISKPPNPMDNLRQCIEHLIYIMDDYPTLRRQEVQDWIYKAQELL